MITFMIKNLELFDRRDEAYGTAAWYGMLHIMQEVGKRREELNKARGNSIGKHVIRVCVNLAVNPQHLEQNLHHWQPPHKNGGKPRFDTLKNLGLYTPDDTVNPQFAAALDIFTDQDWFNELHKNTNFGDSLDNALELADYYKPSAIESLQNGYVIEDTFRSVYRDIDFYVGLYDPERA